MIISWIRNNKEIFIISLIYLIIFALMLPLRDHAFDDDFAYILTVEKFVKTNRLEILDWSAVSMIFQAITGFVFSKIFGFSMTLLHLISIITTYLGVIFLYLLFIKLSFDKFRSTLFTLVLLFFPFTLQYTYSFMSDTFYLSFLIITIYFYVKGYKEKRYIFLILGSLLAGITLLIRQIAIVIPISFFIVYIYEVLTKTKKLNLKYLICSFIPFITILAIYQLWLKNAGITVAQYLGVQIPAQKAITNDFLGIFNIRKAPVIQRDYIDFFIQRPVGYTSIFFGFLSPYLLIFKYKNIKVRKNLIFILISVIVFLFFILSDKYYGSKFTSEYPKIRLLSDSTLVNWPILWPILVKLSLPVWVILFSMSLKSSRKIIQFKTGKIYKKALVIFNIGFVLFIFRTIQTNNPSGLTTENIKVTLTETWLYFLVIYISLLILLTIFTKIKLQKISGDIPIIFFILLVFLFSFFITISLANYYWINYVNQFSPLIIMLFAYLTKKYELNKFISTLILFFFLIVSFEITHKRYQTEGLKWEQGMLLVRSGVEPKQIIDVNWAWNPYWYFESSFAHEVQQVNGNKYNINFLKLGSWPVIPSDGTVYKMTVKKQVNFFQSPTIEIKTNEKKSN